MRLRFVVDLGKLVSKAIVALEKEARPFTPSHVEYATPDGFYIGARLEGGVQKRLIGYDKTPTMQEFFVEVDSTDEQDGIFDGYMNSIIGVHYDWRAIIGFLVPENEHIPHHLICSSACVIGLRKCRWLQWPIAAPAHLISPRDLLLILSARMQVI